MRKNSEDDHMISSNEGVATCGYCGAEQWEGDIGICMSCGDEICVTCSIYDEVKVDGWVCKECNKNE